MPINWDLLHFSKGPSKASLKEARLKEKHRLDRVGSEKARKRASGRCEIWIDGTRCQHADTQTHHMMGGNGTRAINDSVHQHHKQRCCAACHQLIQHKTHVIRLGNAIPTWRDRYQRKP